MIEKINEALEIEEKATEGFGKMLESAHTFFRKIDFLEDNSSKQFEVGTLFEQNLVMSVSVLAGRNGRYVCLHFKRECNDFKWDSFQIVAYNAPFYTKMLISKFLSIEVEKFENEHFRQFLKIHNG